MTMQTGPTACQYCENIRGGNSKDTWVATYAIEPGVAEVIPWMRAFPDRVALGSLSTELGDVNICLYAFVSVLR